MEIVASVQDMCGYEVWRRIAREAKSVEDGRSVAIVGALMCPQFGPPRTWRRAWLAWERELVECAVATVILLFAAVNVALVRDASPRDLRRHLQVSAHPDGLLASAIEFLDAMHALDDNRWLPRRHWFAEAQDPDRVRLAVQLLIGCPLQVSRHMKPVQHPA
jgi:hypothetical protein